MRKKKSAFVIIRFFSNTKVQDGWETSVFITILLIKKNKELLSDSLKI